MSESVARLTITNVTKHALGLINGQLVVEQLDVSKELKKSSVNTPDEFLSTNLGTFLVNASGGIALPAGTDGKPLLTTSYGFTRESSTYYLEFPAQVMGQASEFAESVKTLFAQDAGKTDPEGFADGATYDLVGDVKYVEGKPTLMVKQIIRQVGN